MAGERVIMLEREAPTRIRVVLWATVPASRQVLYAQGPEAQSAWKGATAADNLNLANGVIAERVSVVSREPGATRDDLQADAVELWQQFQDEVNDSRNTLDSYGRTWNGTQWTGGGR